MHLYLKYNRQEEQTSHFTTSCLFISRGALLCMFLYPVCRWECCNSTQLLWGQRRKKRRNEERQNNLTVNTEETDLKMIVIFYYYLINLRWYYSTFTFLFFNYVCKNMTSNKRVWKVCSCSSLAINWYSLIRAHSLPSPALSDTYATMCFSSVVIGCLQFLIFLKVLTFEKNKQNKTKKHSTCHFGLCLH